ncbi:helix-turn-helix domain-containing protein [Natronorubrum sp. DTA7]|uniref:helix-turn-helix domain-containing protein n=1 Tax=Natronorubrum sp. DTA7 TaxID=3447016 RepID=UPI003F8801BD
MKETDVAGVTELADRLGLAKSTVHNHLLSLERHRYVVNEGGQYRLGLEFFNTGSTFAISTRSITPRKTVSISSQKRPTRRRGSSPTKTDSGCSFTASRETSRSRSIRRSEPGLPLQITKT